MQRLIRSIVDFRGYLLPALLFMAASYGFYLVFSDETLCIVGDEDQLFESLTAVFFFGAGWFFLRSFLIRRNVWFLLLAIVLFVGCGEEISWGQRIFNFSTPESLAEINVQHEFSLHNIEMFNAHDFNHNLKSGMAKLLTVNFLYKLFWLSYCVVLPLICLGVRPIARLAERVRLPVPALLIGMLFVINWVTFKATSVFLLPGGKSEQYYDTIGEMRECISALIFMVLSIYFLNQLSRKLTAACSAETNIRQTDQAIEGV